MAIDQAQKLNAKLLALHRWSLTCADLTYTLLRRLLQSYTGSEEAARLCASLVTALPNKSMEVDCALRELAQMQNTPVFAQVLADFLAQYGHRSFHLDIYYPPFAADPTQVLHLLMTLSRCDDKPLTEEERVAIREQAEQEACQLMSGGLLGWLRRALFEHVLHLAQCYMPLREEQRFYWQKTLALQRNLFLLLGQRMVEAGALREHTHVFFLTKDEIKAYMQGHVNAERCAEWAALRKQQFVFLQQEFDVAPTWSYPPFLRGNRPLGIGRQAHAAQFQGRAISPGLARGRAIVIFSPAEFDRIQLGDVLVTRAVDPGWTPIFGLLSALVMEQGGQLSHGAVVAREYGLPTVAGIPGITQSLHDGDMVVVDGLNGLVAKEADNRTENC